MALLGRLALHYYRPDFIESQAKLVMEDMIEDLLDYDPRDISEACRTWRRKPEATYFPKSGQLIGCIREAQEAKIPHPGGHARTVHRASAEDRKLLESPRPQSIKPWRQILAEKGKTFVVPSEADAPPAKPAQQETVLPDGSLTEQRRAELAALRARVSRVPPDVSREI